MSLSERDWLRLCILGSVDDGKSTLIGRLLHDSGAVYDDHLEALRRDSARLNREGPDLALLTDGLRAEREQGITIDVAYRSFATPRRRFLIADTPGHEQYTRNMATGASTAQLAILLVDARQGLTTQTRRHAFIASLLGIPHVVLAINKMDLVDFDRDVFDRIAADFEAFSARLSFRDVVRIPVCALQGDNLIARSPRTPWYDGPPLLTHLETVHTASDRNLVDFRFPVQYINRPREDFRGYCGTIASGVVRMGEELVALSSGRRARVTRILTPAGESDKAFASQAVTLCLDADLDIGRGDMLAHPGNIPHQGTEVECMLVWMDTKPLDVGRTYWIKQTTRSVKGVFHTLSYRIAPDTLHRESVQTLELNEVGRATLDLFQPICFDAYESNRTTGAFIVIDAESHATAAAGMILNRMAQRPAASDAAEDTRSLAPARAPTHASARCELLGQRPFTLWLTGLSGSGKTTIALELERQLLADGRLSYVLDGDQLRHGLNRDLGFSPEDRRENMRRAAETARLMNDAGLIVIAAFISPLNADRSMIREIIGAEQYAEIFVDTPLAECERRDPRGLYRKAHAGLLPGFTGVDAPYEPPVTPDLRLDTTTLGVEGAAGRLLRLLEDRAVISAVRNVP